MIQSEQVGRRLILTVPTGDDEPPIAPYVVPPVNVKVGRMLTGYFLASAAGNIGLTENQQEAMFAVALDGGVFDEELDDIRANRDEDGNPITPNYTRSGDELTASEQEELFWKAFLWQSLLGHEGIAVYDADGGGTAGMLKSMRLLMTRSNPQLLRAGAGTTQAGPQTKPSPTVSSADVPSASNKLGDTVDKMPRGKRSRKRNVD